MSFFADFSYLLSINAILGVQQEGFLFCQGHVDRGKMQLLYFSYPDSSTQFKANQLKHWFGDEAPYFQTFA